MLTATQSKRPQIALGSRVKRTTVMHLSIFFAIFGFALHVVVSLPVPPDFHYLIYHSEVKDEKNGMTYAASRLKRLTKEIPKYSRKANFHKTKSEQLYRDTEEHRYHTEMGQKSLRRAEKHRKCWLGCKKIMRELTDVFIAVMDRIIESYAS